MSYRLLEGGRCANCGTRIGSYQFNPYQTQIGSRNFCGQHCADEFRRGSLI